MKHRIFVDTNVGKIAVETGGGGGTAPVIFLHGVYYDRGLWEAQIDALDGAGWAAIDMPHHGESREVRHDWSLGDCGAMLVEILDSLEIERAVAVGHSWGGMTLLRAASADPARFAAIGLCNTPLEEGNLGAVVGYYFQSTMLPFRSFYAAQAAKAIVGATSLRRDPGFVERIRRGMSVMSDAEIRHVDVTVAFGAKGDGAELVRGLKIPAAALRGVEDYVPDPPGLELEIVPGGHSSPVEAPKEVAAFVQRLRALAEGGARS